MSLSPFTAFTQQPQICSAFARLWHLSPFFSILLKFRKNVYAFVCFGTNLRTFRAAMYTFASLKGILCQPAAEICGWKVFQKCVPAPLLQTGLWRRFCIEMSKPKLKKATHLYSFVLIFNHFSSFLLIFELGRFFEMLSLHRKNTLPFYSLLLPFRPRGVPLGKEENFKTDRLLWALGLISVH